MRDKIKKQLVELPEEIYNKEIDLLKQRKTIEEKEFALKSIEIKTKDEVMRESQTEALREHLSNEAKRKTALLVKLKHNSQYQETQMEVMESKRLLWVNEEYCNLLKRQFRAAEGLARLGL